jgi:predicted secreted protein
MEIIKIKISISNYFLIKSFNKKHKIKNMLKINFTMKRNLAITNFLFIPLIWLYLISCEAAPTFELSEIQPQSIQIRKGEFGTFVLTIIPKNGFSGVVSFELLDRKTNGSIVGIDISPVAASIVGVSSQTFIVNVANFVEPKKYQLKIRVSYGASNFKEKNIDIEVLPQPAFSLGEPIPNSLVVPIGGSASFSVPITPQDGFKGKVSLELRDINTNSQMLDFSLFPNEISLLEPVTQTIVLNVNYTAKEGTYNLKLRGVSGDIISDTKFQVVVSGQIGPIVVPQIPQYFEISELAPRSITLPRGGKANLSVSIVPKNDFKGQISLEILERNSNSLIEGINLFPYSLHILEPVTQTITLYANPEIPEGEYKLKIRAVSGSIFDDEDLDVKIIPPPPAEEPPGDGTTPQPSFDISDLNPPSLTIGKGDEGYFLVQITPQNGFYGDIFFDVLSGANVITWLTLNPQSVRVYGGMTQQIYVKVSPNAITGNFSLKFRASSGSIFREKTFSLNITEGTPAPPSQPSSYFEISDPYPASLTIGKGDEGYFLVQITPQNGFYGDIFFDVLSGANVITWLTLNPQSVRVYGGMTQQIYVKVSPNAITGNFSLKLRASSGSIFREKTFSLSISESPSPSFEISDPNPVSLVVAAGQIKTFSLTITPQNGFSGLVNLYVVDRNTGGTIYGISATPYSISVNQQVTQVVSLNVDSSVSYGYYALKIKASSGGIVREKNIDLVVRKLFWAKAYGPTGNLNDEAYSIQRTKDGGFIVAGYMTIFGTNTDAWVLKLDPDGNVQWQKVFGGPFTDAAYEVKESYDGSFIVAGSSVTYPFTPGTPNQSDGFIVKLDSNGNFAWSLTYGGSLTDQFRSLTIYQEGVTEYIIVTGSTRSFGSGGEDAWILKINYSDGSTVWQKTYGTPNDDRFQRVITSSYNGSISYVFAGRTATPSTNSDLWVMITDKDGNIQMSKKYYYPSLSPGGEQAWDIKETTDGAFVVGNFAERYIGSGGKDMWILKIRKDNGGIIWQKAFGGPGSLDDEARSLLVEENGDIIIAGAAHSLVSSSSNYDIWILRLDKDGNLKWQKVFGLPGSNADLASSICLSDDGNFVVAGYTTTSGGGNDIFVMKITPDGYIKFNSGSSMRSQDSLGLDITTYAISQDVSTSISTTSASPASSNFTPQDRTYWIVHHAP